MLNKEILTNRKSLRKPQEPFLGKKATREMVQVPNLLMIKMDKLRRYSTNSRRTLNNTNVLLDVEIEFHLVLSVIVLILGKCLKQT